MALIGAAAERVADGREAARNSLRQWLVTGAALTVPLLVTLVVLGFVLNFLSNALAPLATGVETYLFPGRNAAPNYLLKAGAVVVLLGVMVVVGFLAQNGPTDGRVARSFHEAIEAVPGVGSVYTGFRQMSEVVVESDADSFQEVKLVEYPTEGSYTLAFVTADTPNTVQQAVGRQGMVTLFMPMAPNPVMGGFVIHVDRTRVHDIDITVEEGIQSIVTSGVTMGGEGTEPGQPDLDPEEIASIGQESQAERRFGDEDDVFQPRQVATDRTEEYDRAVDPEHASTPEAMARRERDEGVRGREMDGRPARRADRDRDQREHTERRPAEMADRDRDRRDDTDRRPAEAADRTSDQREHTERRPAEMADRDRDRRGDTQGRPADTGNPGGNGAASEDEESGVESESESEFEPGSESGSGDD
jgi:uncharacterized membrane protein